MVVIVAIISILTNGIGAEIVLENELSASQDVNWTSLIIEIVIGFGLAAIGKMVWDIREKLTGLLVVTAKLKEVDNKHDSEILKLQEDYKEDHTTIIGHGKDITRINQKLKLN